MARKTRLASWVAILLAASAMNVSAASEAGDLHPDAASYARSNGVSQSEAARRLDLQSIAGELDEQIAEAHKATFGGLWIQHAPDFRIVVLATDGDANIWRGLPASSKLEGLVEVRPAKYTLETLDYEAAAFGDEAHALGVNMRIDVMENRIDLIPTSAAVTSTLSKAGVPPMMWRDPVEKEGRVAANSYGGLALSDGCTTGFSVQTTTAVPAYGIAGAGHCGNGGITLGGLGISYKAELFGGSHDEQWHETPNHADLRQFVAAANFPPRAVTSVKLRANQAINTYMCKYGRVLGYRCGYLTSKTFQPSWIPNSTATFHQVQPQGGPDMVDGGDSGGPVFLDYSAWGIVEGEYGAPWCKCDLIFTAVDYIQNGLGVRISVQ